MKLYLSPPFWMALGFLTGGLHFQPGIVIGVIWAGAHFAMLIWIMRDIETAKPPQGSSDVPMMIVSSSTG